MPNERLLQYEISSRAVRLQAARYHIGYRDRCQHTCRIRCPDIYPIPRILYDFYVEKPTISPSTPTILGGGGNKKGFETAVSCLFLRYRIRYHTTGYDIVYVISYTISEGGVPRRVLKLLYPSCVYDKVYYVVTI